MIGLGRMGGNMVRRLLRAGHEGVVFDLNQDSVQQLASEGATGAASVQEFVARLAKPRIAWVMVPPDAPTQQTINDLAALLEKDDIIVDGGNSYFKDDIARAKQLQPKG